MGRTGAESHIRSFGEQFVVWNLAVLLVDGCDALESDRWIHGTLDDLLRTVDAVLGGSGWLSVVLSPAGDVQSGHRHGKPKHRRPKIPSLVEPSGVTESWEMDGSAVDFPAGSGPDPNPKRLVGNHWRTVLAAMDLPISLDGGRNGDSIGGFFGSARTLQAAALLRV